MGGQKDFHSGADLTLIPVTLNWDVTSSSSTQVVPERKNLTKTDLGQFESPLYFPSLKVSFTQSRPI